MVVTSWIKVLFGFILSSLSYLSWVLCKYTLQKTEHSSSSTSYPTLQISLIHLSQILDGVLPYNFVDTKTSGAQLCCTKQSSIPWQADELSQPCLWLLWLIYTLKTLTLAFLGKQCVHEPYLIISHQWNLPPQDHGL